MRQAVLLDRHPLWMAAVENVLRSVGFGVVGKVTEPGEALALVEEHRPHLLIGDIDLNGQGDVQAGLDVLVRARQRLPELKVIVTSSLDDPQLVQSAFDAGAAAYVVKTAHADDLASAVRQAFQHSIYFANHAPPPPLAGELRDLTPRETEILRLAAEGHSNAELAKMLWVTEQTIKFHLSNVYRKLAVANRTEAARWAQMNGLLNGAPQTANQAQSGRAA